MSRQNDVRRVPERRSIYAHRASAHPPVAEAFTGAQAEAPPCCTKCGAMWTAIEDGALACRLCGCRVYVEAWLRAAVARRGFGSATMLYARRDRWEAVEDPDGR